MVAFTTGCPSVNDRPETIINSLPLLIAAFFKIGLLTIGGGMAMLPLIQAEMTAHGWLTEQEFLNILGVAEMTPGPMAVNTATFVGYRVAGIAGSVAATVALCLPSLLCVCALGFLWRRNRNHPLATRILSILRPIIAGLILAVTLVLLRVCLWPTGNTLPAGIDWRALLVAGGVCGISIGFKIHPVLVLGVGTVTGAMLYA